MPVCGLLVGRGVAHDLGGSAKLVAGAVNLAIGLPSAPTSLSPPLKRRFASDATPP